MDVYQYMNFIENKGTCRAVDGSNSLGEGHAKVDYNEIMVCHLPCTSANFSLERGFLTLSTY